MTKKITLLFFICILSALNIYATVYEGSCGSGVRYSLDTETGLLSITGTGAMTNYSLSPYAPWYSYRSYIKIVEISDGVTSIGNYAFYQCSSLSSVTIPNSVTYLGSYAFSGCSGLTSVTIPNSVTSIVNYAFDGCSGLTSVTIPNSVTSIGDNAFYNCSGLISLYIPSSVKSIRNNAFANCTELLDVYCYARKSPTMGTGAFFNSGIQFATLYVPEASLNGYKVTEPWSGFGSIQALSGEYPEVPEITKCATPTILFENGKLSFSCETEGVRFECNFSTPSESYEEGVAVNMPNKLQLSVYATKEGYEDSDVATKEVEVSGGTAGIKGDVNEDGQVNGTDIQEVINIIVEGE